MLQTSKCRHCIMSWALLHNSLLFGCKQTRGQDLCECLALWDISYQFYLMWHVVNNIITWNFPFICLFDSQISIGDPYNIVARHHDITQWRGPSKYNNEMLGAQYESKSPYADFEHPIVTFRGRAKRALSAYLKLW